ncbi:MAG TPA: hypothetical protein VKQ72_23740 [Aggregatilineales bacterium]|nr:hypothetical protein [Aggregatilineales bacterium]
MSSDFRIVGFDAREMWQDFDAIYPTYKQDQGIRKDIVKPLSTDDFIWSSVFNVTYLSPDGKTEIYLDDRLKGPSWKGIMDLWENLQTMLDCLNTGWGNAWESCWIIAISIVPQTLSSSEKILWEKLLVTTVPGEVEKAWKFLGYDVSNQDSESFLSTLGHQESDAQYAPFLNEYHLFTDLAHALEFKQDVNSMPHPRGCYIFGIHLILDAAHRKA